MMHRHILAAAVLFSTAGLAVRGAARETGFLNRAITLDGATYRYVVYVPAEWTAEQKWPMVLFLHGSTEQGDDGVAQSYVGLGGTIRKRPDGFPAVVVMPQCPRTASWQTPSMQALSLATLDAAVSEFNGDSQRLYLTGWSMGGYGTWSLASKHPYRFAALAVVAGGVVWPPAAARRPVQPGSENPYTRTAQKLAHLPIWVFHGSADRNVPVTESRRMAAALKALNARVQYTEYKGVGHNSWEKAYRDPEFLMWLFAQRLDAKENQ